MLRCFCVTAMKAYSAWNCESEAISDKELLDSDIRKIKTKSTLIPSQFPKCGNPENYKGAIFLQTVKATSVDKPSMVTSDDAASPSTSKLFTIQATDGENQLTIVSDNLGIWKSVRIPGSKFLVFLPVPLINNYLFLIGASESHASFKSLGGKVSNLYENWKVKTELHRAKDTGAPKFVSFLDRKIKAREDQQTSSKGVMTSSACAPAKIPVATETPATTVTRAPVDVQAASVSLNKLSTDTFKAKEFTQRKGERRNKRFDRNIEEEFRPPPRVAGHLGMFLQENPELSQFIGVDDPVKTNQVEDREEREYRGRGGRDGGRGRGGRGAGRGGDRERNPDSSSGGRGGPRGGHRGRGRGRPS
jgi:hypothetical protein